MMFGCWFIVVRCCFVWMFWFSVLGGFGANFCLGCLIVVWFLVMRIRLGHVALLCWWVCFSGVCGDGFGF